MSRIRILAMLTVVLVLAAGAVMVSGPPVNSVPECESLAKAPWEGISVSTGEIPGWRDFVAKLSESIPSEIDAGAWFTAEDKTPVYHWAVAGDSELVTRILDSLTDGTGRIGDIKVEVAEVPYSLDVLDEAQVRLSESFDKAGIAFSSSQRADVGRIEVLVREGDVERARSLLSTQFASCQVEVEPGDPTMRLMISRQDQPPYKAGKRINVYVPNPPGSGYEWSYTCTTAFVFERNGSGVQPILGSTAGHCAGQFLPNDESDTANPGVTIARQSLRICYGPPMLPMRSSWTRTTEATCNGNSSRIRAIRDR